MATLTHEESRRLYSWWWNSHISPKNSKWLQENLSDMDMKVKSMIKLIEEDADSFARRAEMYYKKRPELMKLVEEFYRAYRALAERYDHATGALRQAHRTIEETFPNQIPFALSDESPGSFVSTEAASRTREMSPPIHALFDYDDSLKDDFNMSSQYQSIKRGYYDKNDALTNKKGLDQFNQRPGSEEETTYVKSSEGSASKGSHFLDEEQNNSEFNMQEASQLTKDNEYLKSQIISQSLRAETSEAEVQGLKEVISQLNSEKEAALIQSNLSLEYISKLETEISQSKDNFQKLNNEMQTVTGKLNFAEEQHLLLGNSNQVLQLELDAFNQRSNKLQEDLNKHQEEFELLKNSLQDEHIRFLQAEKASLSFEKLLEQSQEEIGLLNLEIQNGTEKLKDTEMIRMGLEKELQELKEENGSLNEKHVASSLEITSLQDEMLFLKDSKAKLDDEFSFHIEEKEGLEKELSCLQEERDELEQNCRRLMEQVETANSNVGFLEGLVKELQNGNEELQEICKDRETEKVTHLENLKCMEKISEKNMALENSLSDANDEIDGLREKIKALEEFCESLCSKVNLYLSENTTLASQVETDSHDMKQLSEKNTFLEKSLWDANVELESLREKLKVLEESCQSLCAQKSNLLFEKSRLIQQIEETIQNLGNLKARYAELDLKCLNLENERNMVLRQALEFEESLKHEREEHETLILSLVQSSKSQLNNLENRIILLQEEGQLREEDAEVVQHKIMDYQIEIFILQRCLCDMNERNLILSLECQNLAEASKYAENVISELKQEVLTQEEKLTSSAQRSEKLREWIQLMLAEICLEKHCGSLDGTEDDALLHLALHEIEVLLKHFSDTRDENQQLILEKSFIITILKQFALDMADLTVDKNAAEGEYKIKTKKLLLAQNKELELLAENKQLKVELQASNQRQEEHKAEIEVLLAQLRDLEEASGTLKSEVCNLCEENQSLEKKLYESKEKKEILEEENNVIFAEALTLDSLYVISRGSNTDKMHELQMTRNDLCCLQGVKDGLADDILMLTEKFMAIEIENVCFKDAVLSSGECQKLFMIMEDDLRAARNVCKQMYIEIESGKNLLAQKDVELSQALENKSAELCKNIECLHMDTGALVLREELESKIPNLSEENAQINSVIACIHQENDRLNRELCRLHKQVEDLRSREEHLSFEVQKGVDEVNLCESEIAKLLHDVQITTLDAAIFEEKLLELLITCESFEISAIVQRERLHKEITLRTAIVDELKEKIDRVRREKRGLKKEVDAYLFLVPALSDDFNSLEEHITTLAKHHRSHFIKRKDNQLMSPQHNKNSREPIEVHAETMPAGIVELQKLHVKVKALQKVVIDTRRFSEQEMSEFNPTLDAAMKDIEVLKSKRNSSVQEEAEISKYIKQLENRHEPGIGHRPHKGDDEISVTKSEQMIKDIQLDHGLSSSRRGNDFNSYGFSVSEIAGTNDQDLDMWGATESECSNRIQNASSSVRWRDTTNSSQEWNRKVIEGLSSDSQRLQVLQTSVQELKRNIETSETNFPTDFEFDTVKSQLKEAEKSITHLINANSRLAKKANDFSADSDTTVGDQNEIIKSRRKISDRGRRVSEKIGRLELELNKVKYILLKIKEENEAKRVKISDRRKVMLKDYLNGRTESRKQKKIHCRCMRPKTRDD